VDLWKPKSPVLISRNDITPATRGNYTLTIYLFIDAVPDPRATTPLLTWPGIWSMAYNSAQQELVCTVQQSPDQSPMKSEPETMTIPDVPMQRWMQIAITWEGRTANFYVNGTLTKSWSLRNVPPFAVSSLTVVPEGCKGQAAWIQLWNRRLTSGEIHANYFSTCDDNGKPDIGPSFLDPLKNVFMPKLCLAGGCAGSQPSASASQKWEFPYA
jgi:hypothetical protein